ncbi:MAG: tRNA-binding protein [Patescibacteria group bacterium]|nr:tRNA-binding protein [Patescibacteria group bacterium]
MEIINFEEFKKLDMRIGIIKTAEKKEGSEKLLVLNIEIGEETRQILSGIAKFYSPEELIGKRVLVLCNLAPRMIMGLESQGMLLCAVDKEDKVALLNPDKEFPSGTIIT